MDPKKNSCDSIHDRIPPLSSKYPWFVAQGLEDEDKSGARFSSPYTNHCIIISAISLSCMGDKFTDFIMGG